MNMYKNKQNLQLSIFDRLRDDDDRGMIGNEADDIHIVRRAVLRDVENLLNTRLGIVHAPHDHRYLAGSLFTYGVADYTARNPGSPHTRQALKRSIQEAITHFEPRLRNVSVAFRPEEGNHQNLCFAVRATLHADPVCEPITFDTWFAAGRGEYKIDHVSL